MSWIFAEAPAAPTLGQVSYEARMRSMGAEPIWHKIGDDGHADEEAGAQAVAAHVLAAMPQPVAEPARFALVEQMGYRQVIGTVRETQFLGKPMLEVTALDTGSTRLVGADGIYQLTWLTQDQAERTTRTGAHATAAIEAPAPPSHVHLSGADPFGAWADDDEGDSAREAVDAQTLHDSPGSGLAEVGVCPDCGMRHKFADNEL